MKWIAGGVICVVLSLTGAFWGLRHQEQPEPVRTPAVIPPSVRHQTEGIADDLPDSTKPVPSEIRPTVVAQEVSIAEETVPEPVIREQTPLNEIPATLRVLQAKPDSQAARDLIVELIRQWAESDAPAAAEWAENMQAGNVRQDALTGVAIMWSNQDIEQTIQWVLQLPHGDHADAVLRTVGYEASRKDPVVALHVASVMPATQERDSLILHASLQWAARAPAEAAAWADQVADLSLREKMLASIAMVWAESDPFAAATFAADELVPGKTQDDAVVGIVQRWAQTDPQGAVEWVATFPEDASARTAAVQALFQLSQMF